MKGTARMAARSVPRPTQSHRPSAASQSALACSLRPSPVSNVVRLAPSCAALVISRGIFCGWAKMMRLTSAPTEMASSIS